MGVLLLLLLLSLLLNGNYSLRMIIVSGAVLCKKKMFVNFIGEMCLCVFWCVQQNCHFSSENDETPNWDIGFLMEKTHF